MTVPIRYIDQNWREYLSAHLGAAGRADAGDRLCEVIAGSEGAHRVFLTTSGRTALMMALQAMKTQRPERKFVIVPAYVFPSVVLAVRLVGLSVRFAPVGKDLNISASTCERSLALDVLAVVVVHMYGYVADFAPIQSLARVRGVFVIEDSAHCVPQAVSANPVRAGGDCSIFSFGLSKAVSNGYPGRGVALLVHEETLLGEVEGAYSAAPASGLSYWNDVYFCASCLWELQYDRIPWRLRDWIRERLRNRLVDPWRLAKLSSKDAGSILAEIHFGSRARLARANRVREILNAVPDGEGYRFPHRSDPESLTRLAVCTRARLEPGDAQRVGRIAGMKIRMGYELESTVGLPYGSVFEVALGASWRTDQLRRLVAALNSIEMQ